MFIPLALPVFHSDIETITIDTLLIEEGQKVNPGMEMLSCTVDLGGVSTRDCPPLMSYSVVAAEAGVVRKVYVEPGSQISHGQPLGLIEVARASSQAFGVFTAAIIRPVLW